MSNFPLEVQPPWAHEGPRQCWCHVEDTLSWEATASPFLAGRATKSGSIVDGQNPAELQVYCSAMITGLGVGSCGFCPPIAEAEFYKRLEAELSTHVLRTEMVRKLISEVCPSAKNNVSCSFRGFVLEPIV